jgi:RimJ/RimL family protein N-acetyltransferase
MEMRHFQKSDFEAYRSWYADPDLNRELGPMDEQWLEHVLNENPPRQFAFIEDDVLVAVIGTAGPEPDETAWFITDFAVNPGKKRTGIATRALKLLIERHRHHSPQPRSWIAWVDATNVPALEFFLRLGWNQSKQPDVENMFQLSLEMKS